MTLFSNHTFVTSGKFGQSWMSETERIDNIETVWGVRYKNKYFRFVSHLIMSLFESKLDLFHQTVRKPPDQKGYYYMEDIHC